MTRTEEALVQSLENRVRAKDRVITDQQELLDTQALLIERLTETTAYLVQAVELLALPRHTDAAMRRVIEELTLMVPSEKGEVRH